MVPSGIGPRKNVCIDFATLAYRALRFRYARLGAKNHPTLEITMSLGVSSLKQKRDVLSLDL